MVSHSGRILFRREAYVLVLMFVDAAGGGGTDDTLLKPTILTMKPKGGAPALTVAAATTVATVAADATELCQMSPQAGTVASVGRPSQQQALACLPTSISSCQERHEQISTTTMELLNTSLFNRGTVHL